MESELELEVILSQANGMAAQFHLLFAYSNGLSVRFQCIPNKNSPPLMRPCQVLFSSLLW